MEDNKIENNVKKGLIDVIALESKISFIDGIGGNLVYCGYDIKDLAEHSSFEEIIYLLWYGQLPTKKQLDKLDKELKENRALSKPMLELIRSFPKTATHMEMLLAIVPALSMLEPEKQADIKRAIKLTAKFPTIVAAFERIKNDKEPIPPNNALSHAGNFLYMLTNEKPNKFFERILDVCFILHADHELNASTFAVRVAASTLSDMNSAITAGISTLKGPLHGGANEKVMHMLLDINKNKETINVKDYIKNKSSRKEKIMGFGHRVYKTKDPRAKILEEHLLRLAENSGNNGWYELSKEVEEVVTRHFESKNIYANVDFYSASIYYYLGMSTGIFPAIFACSRIAGWIAHALEQYENNKLIRPIAKYVHHTDLEYIPIEKR
ncbi:MAG: citrate/2-methylcitrate synthase [Candidatus Woesearchaeota archaeon]